VSARNMKQTTDNNPLRFIMLALVSIVQGYQYNASMRSIYALMCSTIRFCGNIIATY